MQIRNVGNQVSYATYPSGQNWQSCSQDIIHRQSWNNKNPDKRAEPTDSIKTLFFVHSDWKFLKLSNRSHGSLNNNGKGKKNSKQKGKMQSSRMGKVIAEFLPWISATQTKPIILSHTIFKPSIATEERLNQTTKFNRKRNSFLAQKKMNGRKSVGNNREQATINIQSRPNLEAKKKKKRKLPLHCPWIWNCSRHPQDIGHTPPEIEGDKFAGFGEENTS